MLYCSNCIPCQININLKSNCFILISVEFGVNIQSIKRISFPLPLQENNLHLKTAWSRSFIFDFDFKSWPTPTRNCLADLRGQGRLFSLPSRRGFVSGFPAGGDAPTIFLRLFPPQPLDLTSPWVLLSALPSKALLRVLPQRKLWPHSLHLLNKQRTFHVDSK